MIKATHVFKSYKDHVALENVSLSVQESELFGIAGLNGAGKSTLLSVLTGLIRPDSGTVYYRDVDIFSTNARSGLRIGFVPQEIALFQDLRVFENLEFWAWTGTSQTKEQVRDSAMNAAFQSGLEHVLKKKLSALSGGMKRRVNIAAALAMNPDVLIMDEPTVGLDVKNRRDIMRFIRALVTQSKSTNICDPVAQSASSNATTDPNHSLTVIFTSHQSGELETFCDRLLLLHRGKSVYEGSLADVVPAFSRTPDASAVTGQGSDYGAIPVNTSPDALKSAYANNDTEAQAPTIAGLRENDGIPPAFLGIDDILYHLDRLL